MHRKFPEHSSVQIDNTVVMPAVPRHKIVDGLFGRMPEIKTDRNVQLAVRGNYTGPAKIQVDTVPGKLQRPMALITDDEAVKALNV